MSKYYTPQIEEFYIGFEYEYKNSHISSNGEWYDSWELKTLESFKDLYDFIDGTLLDIQQDIRVKHLDREDIEECGWWFDDENGNRAEIEGGGYILFIQNNRDILIKQEYKYNRKENYYIGFNTLFDGTIKNKSELKRIMKIVGIE